MTLFRKTQRLLDSPGSIALARRPGPDFAQRMMVHGYALFVSSSLLLVSANALGDLPPRYVDFETYSANELYSARVEATSDDVDPWERSYKLSVFDRAKNLLWSSPFHYNGYPGGFLSPDGSRFVVVEFWFNERRQVDIYGDKFHVSIPGTAFKMPSEAIVETASHRLWLSRDELVGGGLLVLETRDGRLHALELENGKLASQMPKHRDWDTPILKRRRPWSELGEQPEAAEQSVAPDGPGPASAEAE